jgi:hypothetical protein
MTLRPPICSDHGVTVSEIALWFCQPTRETMALANFELLEVLHLF